MSVLADLIYGGANAVAGLAENGIHELLTRCGPQMPVSFPDTQFYFPALYAATGIPVKTVADLPLCAGALKEKITAGEAGGNALDAGLAALLGMELLEGLKFAQTADPYEQESGMGFLPDGLIPLWEAHPKGMALVLGSGEAVPQTVAEYQKSGLLTFLVGDCIEQCQTAGLTLGTDGGVIPLGHDMTAAVYPISLALRSGLQKETLVPGSWESLPEYTKAHVPAFINTFGSIDAVVIAFCAGAMALGIPTVLDMDLGENQVPGMLESVSDSTQTAKRSLELLSCQ